MWVHLMQMSLWKNLHLNNDMHQILLVELEAPELTRLNSSGFKILVVNQVQAQTSSIIRLSLGKELNHIQNEVPTPKENWAC